ncbi:MAG: hypothetical protein V3T79_03905 [Candidatus Scalindua sediminis]|jgi:hypothetical protein
MEIIIETSQFKLPEANQGFKQGQKVNDFGLKNIGQKSAKESESENISQNIEFDYMNIEFDYMFDYGSINIFA